MSLLNDVDTKKLLERWAKAKVNMIKLEKRVEKYKKVANGIMNKEGEDILSSIDHTLRRKKITRLTISKKDVPENVWSKYAKPCSYYAYYLES